jgi:hypothetical protein
MTENFPLMRVAPPWVTRGRSDEERLRRLNVMLLRQCAVWFHPSGAVSALSRGLGLGPRTLGAYAANKRLVTPELAIRIEALLGRHVIRREDFRPDLFLPKEKTPGD